MTRTRARKRSMISVMSASVLLLAALVGCGSTESQREAFERYGYSNVENLKNEGRPNSWRATLNNCTVDLSRTADKEIWVAVIIESPLGEIGDLQQIPGDNAFEYAHKTDELRKDPRFIRYCPNP